MTTTDGESDFWTNPSVLDFACGEDPVEAVTSRAREVAFDAVQEGWRGPPFDPIALARSLSIEVAARDDLSDARVLAEEGRLRIEYNPTRPRGRLRYSVAHEIAHTFFPDVGNQVRHRTAMGAVDEGVGDDWQLEMLCNIAAGELLVPAVALPPDELDDAVTDIGRLMALRAAFDVSSEAILRRAAQAANHHVTMFAAARVAHHGKTGPRFRLDYTVGSRAWDPVLARGLRFDSKVLSECTAVGYTATGVERWTEAGSELDVLAVGIPPYPGQSLPRLAGILLRDARASTGPTISYVTGDATEPRGDGYRLIAHVVNDKARTWGGRGFAAGLRRRHPQAADAFRAWTIASGDNLRLGHTHVVDVGEGIAVASMVAQEGYGASDNPRIRYHALAECLASVSDAALRRGATVHMPRIGIGQGGGTWPLIEDEIDRALCAKYVPVTIYTLPDEHHDLVLSRRRPER